MIFVFDGRDNESRMPNVRDEAAFAGGDSCVGTLNGLISTWEVCADEDVNVFGRDLRHDSNSGKSGSD